MPKNVKITTILNPLNLLAPHSCRGCGRIGEALCDCCKNDIIVNHHNFCPYCKKLNLNGICSFCKNPLPIFTVANRNSLIGALIKEYKYQSVRSLSSPFADIINQILPNIDGEIIVVPLPTIGKHIRNRGLDHTLLLAKKFTKLRSNTKIQKILIRDKNTVQVGATRKNRMKQAKSAYKINPKTKINKNSTYLLLDDVWTTGASMESATKKLRQAGVSKIIVSLLAVSDI